MFTDAVTFNKSVTSFPIKVEPETVKLSFILTFPASKLVEPESVKEPVIFIKSVVSFPKDVEPDTIKSSFILTYPELKLDAPETNKDELIIKFCPPPFEPNTAEPLTAKSSKIWTPLSVIAPAFKVSIYAVH